jgi:WD40 repeat protein
VVYFKSEVRNVVLVAAVFSPDGKLVVFASNSGTIWLRDSGTGAIYNKVKFSYSGLKSVKFPPDGKIIASVFSDCAVRL